MERTIKKVTFTAPIEKPLTRVAAYARVSTGKDAMLHSLSAQVSYYSNLIQNHPGWSYAGVYADEAVTGTKEERENFQRLISDCKAGKIDMVITKSISRFARNTVTLLETVRDLKSIGIDIFFEEQNIHTMSSDGELMLTILASYAQEESRSVSENCKWRIRKNFEEGIFNTFSLYGYEKVNGEIRIKEDEAEVIRKIFKLYLNGLGAVKIAKELRHRNIPSPKGKRRSGGVSFLWRSAAESGLFSRRGLCYNKRYIFKIFPGRNHREYIPQKHRQLRAGLSHHAVFRRVLRLEPVPG